MRVGPEVLEPIALGMTKAFWEDTRGTETIQIRKHMLWGKKSRMPGVCMTCTATCGSGARIGMKTLRRVQGLILLDHHRVPSVLSAAEAGASTRGAASLPTATGEAPATATTSSACASLHSQFGEGQSWPSSKH